MAESQNSEQAEAATARQRCGKHISAAMNQYTIIEEQLQAMFSSMWCAPRLYS
jgi:hypothetical protein